MRLWTEQSLRKSTSASWNWNWTPSWSCMWTWNVQHWKFNVELIPNVDVKEQSIEASWFTSNLRAPSPHIVVNATRIFPGQFSSKTVNARGIAGFKCYCRIGDTRYHAITADLRDWHIQLEVCWICSKCPTSQAWKTFECYKHLNVADPQSVNMPVSYSVYCSGDCGPGWPDRVTDSSESNRGQLWRFKLILGEMLGGAENRSHFPSCGANGFPRLMCWLCWFYDWILFFHLLLPFPLSGGPTVTHWWGTWSI